MTERAKGAAFFPLLFALISLVFIAILGYVYVQTRKANPVVLDEHGKVRSSTR